jgi:hypothetical protein
VKHVQDVEYKLRMERAEGSGITQRSNEEPPDVSCGAILNVYLVVCSTLCTCYWPQTLTTAAYHLTSSERTVGSSRHDEFLAWVALSGIQVTTHCT